MAIEYPEVSAYAQPPSSAHPSTLRRIDDTLRASAKRTPAKTAIVDGGRAVDYATLLEASAALAHRLASSGVGAGDRVAIFLDKTVESAVAMYGVWLAGGVAVPVN